MKLRIPHIAAIAVTVGIGIWMASGSIVISGSGGDTRASDGATSSLDTAIAVRVREYSSSTRQAHVTMRGRTEPVRRVRVAAQTRDQLVRRPVEEGDRVAAGDLLCVLATGARDANVLQAEALLAQATLDFSAAEQLGVRGYAAETRIHALRAARDGAAAALEAARIERAHVEIHAPISGIVDDAAAEVGSLLSTGDACATLVDLDPLIVTGQISEREIGGLQVGMTAVAHLVTGETREGSVRFIAPAADMATRTFTVEIALPNPDNTMRAGVTASADIPIAPVNGMHLNASVLVLADDGTVGIRAVNDENRVVFMPVTIIGDDTQGFWVTGLPDTVNIIVVGQDFVSQGQLVEPVQVETLTQERSAS